MSKPDFQDIFQYAENQVLKIIRSSPEFEKYLIIH